MIARALAVLGGGTLTPPERAAGGMDGMERAEFTGEAPDTGDTRSDWDKAMAAAKVPGDAMVLWWIREDSRK